MSENHNELKLLPLSNNSFNMDSYLSVFALQQSPDSVHNLFAIELFFVIQVSTFVCGPMIHVSYKP